MLKILIILLIIINAENIKLFCLTFLTNGVKNSIYLKSLVTLLLFIYVLK